MLVRDRLARTNMNAVAIVGRLPAAVVVGDGLGIIRRGPDRARHKASDGCQAGLSEKGLEPIDGAVRFCGVVAKSPEQVRKPALRWRGHGQRR